MSSLAWYFQLVCLLTAYLFVVFIFDALKVILLHLRIQLFWAVPLFPWVSICSHLKSHLAFTFNVHHSHSAWQGHCSGEGCGSEAAIPRGRVQTAAAVWVAECIFQMKKIDFMYSTKFRLLSQAKGNSISDTEVFKVHNFC